MDAFECYLVYRAVKAHFNTKNYNYLKYDGKIKANRSHFERRNDVPIFSYIAKRYKKQEVLELFVSNLLLSQDFYVGNNIAYDCETTYLRWKGRMNDLIYRLDRSVFDIADHWTDVDPLSAIKLAVDAQDGYHPLLLQMLLRGEISPEIFLIYDYCFGVLDRNQGKISEKIVWPNFYKKMKKYKPLFVRFVGKEKIKALTHRLATTLSAIQKEEADKDEEDDRRRDSERNSQWEFSQL